MKFQISVISFQLDSVYPHMHTGRYVNGAQAPETQFARASQS